MSAEPDHPKQQALVDKHYAETALTLIEEAVASADRRAEAALRERDLLREAAAKMREALLLGSTAHQDVKATNTIFFPYPGNGEQRAFRADEVPLSTVEAVRRVLAAPANQGNYFTVKALVHLMQENGVLRTDLAYPQNTVLEAAKRLVRRDSEHFERIDRDGMALFRMKVPEQASGIIGAAFASSGASNFLANALQEQEREGADKV